jgi:methyl-accepting chemotaxis protein
MKIQIKLSLLTGYLIIMGLLIGIIGYLSLVRSDRQMTDIMNNEIEFRLAMENLQILNLTLRRYEKDYLLNMGSREKQNSYQEQFQTVVVTMEKIIEENRRQTEGSGILASDPEAIKQYQALSVYLEHYVNGVNDLILFTEENPETTPQEGNQFLGANKQNSYNLAEDLTLLEELSRTHMETREEVIQKYSQRAKAYMSLLSLLFLLSLPVAFYLGHSISSPIGKAAIMLKDIAEGEGDLTRKMDLNRKDEMGLMGEYFNLTLDKIRQLVNIIKEQADGLSHKGDNLSKNMTETTESIVQIDSHLLSIREKTASQTQISEDTSHSLKGVTQTSAQLEGDLAKQYLSLNQSSAAIEEMTASIESVTGTLLSNRKDFDDLKSSAKEGTEELNRVNTHIRDLSEESEKLLEVSALIQNIASQTNLLSMNAAIEAAHAGDSGRGFAVVADEIRKLAETSGSRAKLITDELVAIRDSLGKLSVSTGSALGKVKEIDREIDSLYNREEEVTRSMEEQSLGSRQIREAMTDLSTVTDRVKEGSRQMGQHSQELGEQSDELNHITREIRERLEEITDEAGRIKESIGFVNNLSRENKDSIVTLTEELGKFRT